MVFERLAEFGRRLVLSVLRARVHPPVLDKVAAEFEFFGSFKKVHEREIRQ